MIVDTNAIPIEFCFIPGSTSDIAGLKMLPCELPKDLSYLRTGHTTLIPLKMIKEMAEFILVPRRKKNMTRQHPPIREFILNQTRNRIETVFSAIISKMPRHIRARTERGFYLKITFFIIAYLFSIS